jgi:hypothetical protein
MGDPSSEQPHDKPHVNKPERPYRVYNHASTQVLVTALIGGNRGVYRLLPGCASPEDARPVSIHSQSGSVSDGKWDMWNLDPSFDVYVTERSSQGGPAALHAFGLGVHPVQRNQPWEAAPLHDPPIWASNCDEMWVTILGAGIAGLTAAHELVIRGFRVQVIEKAHGSPVDETGHTGTARFQRGLDGPDVGGVARTQWTTQPLARGDTVQLSRPSTPPGLAPMRSVHGDCHWFGRTATGPQECAGYWVFGVAWNEGAPRADTAEQIREWLEKLGHRRSIAAVQLVMVVYREDRNEGEQVKAAYARLKQFRDHIDLPAGEKLRGCIDRLEVFPTARIDVDDAVGDKDHVGLLVRVHEDLGLVAGEHGFRFFPGFYRHLRDTMRRTPIYDPQTRTFTARSTHDNLTEVEWQVVADPQRNHPASLRRKPFSSVSGLMEQYRNMRRDLGYRPVDLFRFLLRILRYTTSSTRRRKEYYERLSWWDFLSLCHFNIPTSDARRFSFGRRFEEALVHSPKALVAMGGRYTDARTQGNISVQLFMDQFALHEQSDSTLTGPTSSAWLSHWRTYLEQQGVRFFLGEVTRIHRSEPAANARGGLGAAPAGGPSELQDRHCDRCGLFHTETTKCVSRATVDIAFASERPPDYVDAEQLFLRRSIRAHYYVSAMDIVGLARTTRSFRALRPRERNHTLHQLKDYGVLSDLSRLLLVGDRERDLEDITEIGRLGPHHGLDDRFQTLTGIQFYYRSYVSFENGHIYFASSPWGLSAVSQIQYWGPFGNGSRSRLASNLSVDIGSWRATREKPSLDPNHFQRDKIALEVQDQILRSLARARRDRENTAAYYHLDDFIGFSSRTDGRPTRNHAPFLINVVDDWKNRPRGNPWAPNALHNRVRVPGQGEFSPDGIWCHEDDGYLVHFGNLVIAGTHMRTFTRMGTMEAANESARHAVNAILDHLSFAHRRIVEPPAGTFRDAEPESQRTVPQANWTPPPVEGKALPLNIEVDKSTTPFGDYCQIWNPEDHEFSDLDFLRLVDEHLMDATLQPDDDLPEGPEPIAPHLFDILRIDELPDLIDGDREALGAFELLASALGAFQESSCDSLPSVFAIVEKVRKQLSALFQRKK